MKTRHLALIALTLFFSVTASPMAVAGQQTETTPVADAATRTLELVNRDRASAGLQALSLDREVTDIAAGWSPKMANDRALSHNEEYLSEASMQRLHATRVGENVAFADSIDEIHAMFMNSPPHRANILQPDYRQIGVAAVRTSDGSIYLTEDFLTRDGGSSGGQGEPPAPKKSPPRRGVKRRR